MANENVLDQLEAMVESGGTIPDMGVTISAGEPVEGFLESRSGTLIKFSDRPIECSVTELQIAELSKQAESMTLEDEKLVSMIKSKATSYTTTIEAERKNEKAVALEYGKRVDILFNRLKTLVLPIKEKATKLKQEIEFRKEEAKRLKEEAKRALVDSRAKQLAELEWTTNFLVLAEMTDEEFDEELSKASEYFAVISEKRKEDQAKREAEEAKKREADRLEREQVERDRQELEELRAAKAKAEKEAIAKQLEEKRIADEKLEAQRIEHERQQDILRKQFAAQNAETERLRAEAEQEATKQRLEAERLQREAKAIEDQKRREEIERQIEAERVIAEQKRKLELEAMKPDALKIEQFGAKLDSFILNNLPASENQYCQNFLTTVKVQLKVIADSCKTFSEDEFPF
jgi:hypothetical protein